MLGGVVFAGVCSSFAFMLAERGESPSTISAVLSATIPYGLKFMISPFVRNYLIRFTEKKSAEKKSAEKKSYGERSAEEKFDEKKFNRIKVALCCLQFCVFALLSTLGLFAESGPLWLAWLVVFTTTLMIAPIDIACAHIKLVSFKEGALGLTASIENIGFRIGLFIAGAFILYVASMVGWGSSFMLTGAVPFALSIISTTLLRNIGTCENVEFSQMSSARDIAMFFVGFLKRHGTLIITIMMISFKFPDSCINGLKSVFLCSIGIDKITFASISYSIGIVATIIGSSIAGILYAKVGIEKCIRLSLILHCVASALFLFLASFKVSVACVAAMINVSTLIFGFSCITLRTYLAEESRKDANVYISFISIGSLLRTISCSIGGAITNTFSWKIMFATCIVSAVPGFYIYTKHIIKKRT
jgi:PAT family beta-lactamase induction signal transducer AmpG